MCLGLIPRTDDRCGPARGRCPPLEPSESPQGRTFGVWYRLGQLLLPRRRLALGYGRLPTGNPWQNVDRLRRQWLADFDRDPLDGLDAETVRTLRLALSRRHLLERNGGVIDERFRRETGEGSIGRRIRIAPAFVDRVDDAVVSLAERLGATAH